MTARPHIERRDPAVVMRLSRLGSLHQSRLSFMRILTRRMAREKWQFSRPVFDIGANGEGRAVYTTIGPERSYSLVAFAHDLPADQRSDRVIATAWDATFTLFDGVPSAADLDRLAENIPYQEAGRVTESELSVARANRSVRLWEHVVDALAKGFQPDRQKIDKVGYLMRTTAVYGSGKLGAADREKIADRPEMRAPFQGEMLVVFLVRCFVRDLVEHMAKAKGGDQAVCLDPEIARSLGIGNSTGLGMAPFIINHPLLFNNWIAAREDAILQVRSVKTATQDEIAIFLDLLEKSDWSVQNWHSEHPIQIEKLEHLNRDLDALNNHIASVGINSDFPWHALLGWAETELGEEGQELLASLILEPYGDLVDVFEENLAVTNADAFQIDGSMSVADLRALIRNCFGWAFETEWDKKENCARAWYVSEEKLEPRLGERFDEPIADYEQPLAPTRDACAAFATLEAWDDAATVAAFLLDHPEHRHTVRRAQISQIAPYGEIRDNTIGSQVLPIDMLRAKLSFFGATHFDPRSDRWVRISMYGDAPYPEQLDASNCDYWVYPTSKPTVLA